MFNYDIFISYRREGGYDTAKHLYDLLTLDKYKVSFDIDTLREGDFDRQLLKRIDQCKDFILIVDKHTFGRTLDPSFDSNKDWLRIELAYALKKKKNVIPILLSGVEGFPANLPKDIEKVTTKNGPEYNRYYFNDFYKVLKSRFLTSKSKNYKIRSYFLIVALILLLLIIPEIISWNKETKEIFNSEKVEQGNNQEEALRNFTGRFTYIEASETGGINTNYELVLDPVNSKATIVEDGIVNIRNSKGYYGSMMRFPAYWNVKSFNLHKNGRSAVVQLTGPNNSISTVKLELDDYNNIEMSYVDGNYPPTVLEDYKGNYTKATFLRN